MTKLTRIRPSNLVILAVLPFIAYLFTMVPNYRRSIIAIVGIEEGAAALLLSFLLLTATLLAGLVWPVLRLKGRDGEGAGRTASLTAIALNVCLAFIWRLQANIAPLANSIVANLLDPVTSDMVVKAVTPRRLTPEAMEYVAGETTKVLWAYAAISAVLALGAVRALFSTGEVFRAG